MIRFQLSRNSPSGKQYIDNAKHKLIMRIPLESIDLSAGKNSREYFVYLIITLTKPPAV